VSSPSERLGLPLTNAPECTTPLLPILNAARARGRRCFLLTHSMGAWALQAAVKSWFDHGKGDGMLFDEALLAAADEVHNFFDFAPFGSLSGLNRLSRRISVYYSQADIGFRPEPRPERVEAARPGRPGRSVQCHALPHGRLHWIPRLHHRFSSIAPILPPLTGRAGRPCEHYGGGGKRLSLDVSPIRPPAVSAIRPLSGVM